MVNCLDSGTVSFSHDFKSTVINKNLDIYLWDIFFKSVKEIFQNF